MITGKIAKIESMGMLDGPGIRTIVFTQGCVLRCAYCHNPSLLALQGGEEMTPEQLLEKVMRFKPYYKKTGGVTVSGGEPLVQVAFLTEFFTLCKKAGISTCLDTSGVGIGGDYDALLSVTDLVLLDVKHTRPKEFQELTLVPKDRIVPFWESLNRSHAEVWLRQVIMPNYNDNETYLKELVAEVLPLKNLTKVEFLPYHTLAVHIYDELGMKNRIASMPAMDAVKTKELEQQFIAMLQHYKPNIHQNEN